MKKNTERPAPKKLTRHRKLRSIRAIPASPEAEITGQERFFPVGVNAILRSGIRQVIPAMRHGSRANGIAVVARRPADLVGREGEEELDLLMIPEAQPAGDGRGFKQWADFVLSRLVLRGLDAEKVEAETEAWHRAPVAALPKVFPGDSPP